MKPDLSRLLLGPAGLMIGFLLYGWAMKQPEPQQNWAIGGMFALLGITTFFYARGERWIQVLGAVLFVYGLLRAVILK